MGQTQTPNTLRVFISYSRKDLSIAEGLREGLVDRGIEAFLDVHDIAPGEDWKDRLRGLIGSAEKVALLVSPDSVASEICAWEVDEAERQAKPVFPVLVRDTEAEEVPGRLARLNYTFYRTEDERAANLDRLAEALRTDLLWEREKTKLNDQAEAWQTAGRPRRLLITRDDAIRHAETWRDGAPENAQPPTEVQRDFIRESRAHLGRRQRRTRFGLSGVAVLTSAVAVYAVFQQQIAQRNLEEAETVTAFIDDAFASVNPSERGKDILFVEVMDAAAERLETGNADLSSTAEARLRDTIGWSYLQLGSYDEADRHLTFASDTRRNELGEGSEAYATSLYRKTLNDWYLNRTDGLEERFRNVLATQRSVYGETDHRVAITEKDLGWWLMLEGRHEEATEFYESSLAIFEAREDLDDLANEYALIINNYASLKQAIARRALEEGDLVAGRTYFAAAEEDFRQAIDVHIDAYGPDSAGLGTLYGNLAGLFSETWRAAEAEEFHRKGVELSSRTLGDDHYTTLLARSGLAGLFDRECRYEEAREIYEATVPGWAAIDGEDQPLGLDVRQGFVNIYFQLGEHEKAATELEELYDIHRRVNGDAADETLNTLNFLVVAYSWVDNHQRSLEVAEQHYQRLLDEYGHVHLATSRARWILADYLLVQEDYDTVRAMMEEQVESLSNVENDPDNQFAKAADEWRIFLARIDIRERKYDEAAERLGEILRGNDERYGIHNEISIKALHRLSIAYGRQNQPERSIEFREDRLSRLLEKWGEGAPAVWEERDRLARLYLRTDQLDRAQEMIGHFMQRGPHPCDPSGLSTSQEFLVRDLIEAGRYDAAADLAAYIFQVHDDPTGDPNKFVLRALRRGAKARMEQGRFDDAEALVALWKDRLERAVDPSAGDNMVAADAALAEIARRRAISAEVSPG
ncbi:MAG: toll/interleukin-1 receptor domain-containing protein [Pseudomonadota bacterium]